MAAAATTMGRSAAASDRASGMKKEPLRRCVVCHRQGEKGELLRLVRRERSPGEGGAVGIDPRGKQPGRGAYLCREGACRGAFGAVGKTSGQAHRALERALRVTLSPEERADLAKALAGTEGAPL